MTNALEISGLCKEYSNFKLDNVSFTLPKGCIMGFIGANGAGKTTTISSMLNIVKPSAGTVSIYGLNPQKNIREINEQIGVVIEDCFFYHGMKISDIPIIMRGIYKTWSDEKFNDLTNKFELPFKKAIKDLSKGMKMKLMLATALAHNPKLLILDEATSGLDPVVRSEMLDIFLEFIQDENHSILMSSHITTDLERVADYITFIHNGKIVFTQSKDEIMQNYAIAKCSEDNLQLLDKSLIAGIRRSSFSFEALITNRYEASRCCKGILLDSASLDDIMTFIAKGDK